jgi:hypothetical protein
MNTEAEHAQAVARRVTALRLVGLFLLLLGLYIHRSSIAHRFIGLCAGCALIQVAFFHGFPKPKTVVGPMWGSVWEGLNPRSYFCWFWTSWILFYASLGVELWAGFHFLPWKTALLILVFTTIAVDFLATRILFVITGCVGLLLAVSSGILLLTA